MTTENIALQAWRKDISYILHAVQGESDSRTFNFILYDQTGAVISLTGKTVAFYVQKPDGNIVMLATTTSGSTISVTLTLQACAVPGVMPCWNPAGGREWGRPEGGQPSCWRYRRAILKGP